MENKEIFELKDNVLLIHVDGELDHHNSIYIRKKADDIICKYNVKVVIFDFLKTGFMDSSGIGVIMGRYKKIKSLGGNVGVINTSKSIEKILLFSGLNKIVKYYKNVDEIFMQGGKK